MMKASNYLVISAGFRFGLSVGEATSCLLLDTRMLTRSLSGSAALLDACPQLGPLHFRAPPSLTNDSITSAGESWLSPPPGFLYGNWKLGHSSQPGYAD